MQSKTEMLSVRTDSICEATDKSIALTFDDGPDETYTNAVLDILEHYRVSATFFCLGSQVEKHPDVLRKMVRAGHVIGNHSWDHPYFTKETDADIRRQIEKTSDVIEQTTCVRPRLFRPPYGDVDDRVTGLVQGLGYHVVLWDVDSRDWAGIPGPTIVANVVPRLRPQAIVLHHCAGNVAGTVDALPYLIETQEAMGYRFTTLDALWNMSAYQL